MVDLLCSDLLPQIDLALQSLRGEGGDVETVVVKNGVEKLQAIVVEELGNFVTDQAALLQPAHVGLEGQGLVTAAHVKSGDIESDAGTHAGRARGRTGS